MHRIKPRIIYNLSFQPDLRPELPLVDGPKEYRDQHALFLRIEDLLSLTGVEREFITLSMAHRKIDLSARSSAEAQSQSKNCTLAKNTSDRFARLIDAQSLQTFNAKVISLLQGDAQAYFGLEKPISFAAIFFDSTCLKAPIHHPVDWVLLRDATRTLMKATARIRKKGLLYRMPQEPLSFLNDMNNES